MLTHTELEQEVNSRSDISLLFLCEYEHVLCLCGVMSV